MEFVNVLFLQALRASLQKKTVEWESELTPEQWSTLFAVAAVHHVLPMIYEAVIRSAAAQKADPQIFLPVKQQVRQQVILQTIRTDSLLKLLPEMTSAGVTPLVVKGIICRELYPNPDYRISGDEDLFIPQEQFDLCHEKLLANGFRMTNPDQDLKEFEVSYDQHGTPLHIELHKQMFSPESVIFDDFNRFFESAHERAITRRIQGVAVPAMNHTDHLFYLICHSFKHFLYCGFGIRQVCDICLYANAFGNCLDWLQVRKQCEAIHADRFAVALFRIGENYLSFDPETACYPKEWRDMVIDETAMLEDLLEAGVFGKSSESRKLSSAMTIHAVSDQKQGKTRGNRIFNAIFPDIRKLSRSYPYLEKHPYLLPVAWAARIVRHRQEIVSVRPDNSALESLKIGTQRIELLKQYGIIEQ